MNRHDHLAPLGLQRFRLLDCLGATQPRSAGYLAPDPAVDPFLAFRSHIAALSRLWAAEPHEQTASLLAAARLLSGDLAEADAIIDRFPARPYEPDHGHGYCNVAHLNALSAALPLPVELKDVPRWVAGSRDQTALRAWLTEHRKRLRWVETDGVYVLDA